MTGEGRLGLSASAEDMRLIRSRSRWQSTRLRHSARIRRVTMTHTPTAGRGHADSASSCPGNRAAQRDHRRRRRRGRSDDVDRGDGPLSSAGPVRTGVTAILPRGRDGVGQPCAAGWYSLNGNGEMTGTTWIDEAGSFNLPVVLSNTHAVGACHTGVVSWVNRDQPAARPAVAAARVRRDVGRLPQRHQRRPRPARACRGGARRGDARVRSPKDRSAAGPG